MKSLLGHIHRLPMARQGNAYLDFASGIAVNALGYGDKEWIQAITDQAQKIVHVSNLFHTLPALQLAETLVKSSFADLVFFTNSGTEAIEAALKFSRKMGKTLDPGGHKCDIASFTGGFHGRSLGSLSLTWNPSYQQSFTPLIPNTYQVEYNDMEQASNVINDSTCAVLVEPIQGEGGVKKANGEFLRHLRHLCDKHNALLIFDEIQCGLGRTGNLWAYTLPEYQVVPDILTIAKPLANGLPIGAVLVTEKVGRNMQPGDHGSTFSGGPLICAAANSVMARITDPLFLARVRDTSAYLDRALQSLLYDFPDIVKEIRGTGLIRGIKATCPANEIVDKARGKGLIVITAKENVIRLLPPLIITTQHVDKAVDILRECMMEARETTST